MAERCKEFIGDVARLNDHDFYAKWKGDGSIEWKDQPVKRYGWQALPMAERVDYLVANKGLGLSSSSADWSQLAAGSKKESASADRRKLIFVIPSALLGLTFIGCSISLLIFARRQGERSSRIAGWLGMGVVAVAIANGPFLWGWDRADKRGRNSAFHATVAEHVASRMNG